MPPHRAASRRLDAPGLRARGDEHRQHVGPRLTIDYGPYGWLEGYDPQWTPNTTDAHTRRYAYGNQPQIAQWNLARFAEALLPLVGDKAPLEEGLALYAGDLQRGVAAGGRAEAGAGGGRPAGRRAAVGPFGLLYQVETDFTFFATSPACRSTAPTARSSRRRSTEPPAEHRQALASWLRRYAERSRDAARDRVERMNRVNPKYVFRNYLAQLAIDALEQGDASVMERLLAVLERPYDEQPAHEDLAARRPEWARHRAGCSALSCSS